MTNKELVIIAVNEVFINGDATVLDRYWSDNYAQHNPQIAPLLCVGLSLPVYLGQS